MKRCSQCGRDYSDLSTTCAYCGAPLGDDVPASAGVPPTENVVKGFLGACLYGLIGAVIQAILINIGFVAAISGIATYFLAAYGYQKFSGVGDESSNKAVWIGVPISFAMIVLGTLLGYAIYCARVWDVSMSVAARAIRQSSEIIFAMGEDILFSLLLWGVAVFASLARHINMKKKK